MPLHRRLPKRGFTNIFRVEYAVLGLDTITELGESELTLETLQARGIVKKRDGLVKVLANGELKSAVTVHAHKFSKAAKAAIEAAGGKAVLIGEPEAAPAA
jgi:large subunit ribosomal protein L15